MRKRPQQERSRQMVNALIEATAHCIARQGIDGISTPMIAETAGVSVGSLYQYFDDKESLVEALLEKLADDFASLLNQTLMVQVEADLRTLVRNVIEVTVGLMHSNEGLYLELLRNWHRLPVQGATRALEQHMLQAGQLYFLKHYREYPVHNLQARLFICFNSVTFSLVRIIGQESPLLTTWDVVDGLVDMVTGYLDAPAPG